jgi:hypothetical protein
MAENRGHFKKGTSGNVAGRPKRAEAASEIARGLVKKYQIFERLARTAAGEAPDEGGTKPTISEQTNAQKLLLAYGYGTPIQMTEAMQATDVHIQVTYVQQNRIEITGATSGPAEGIERGAEVQCVESGPPLREIDAGPSPADQ